MRKRGFEPLRLAAQAPQACASANFATSAMGQLIEYTKTEGGTERKRTTVPACQGLFPKAEEREEAVQEEEVIFRLDEAYLYDSYNLLARFAR